MVEFTLHKCELCVKHYLDFTKYKERKDTTAFLIIDNRPISVAQTQKTVA
jgi:hypothetical protein